MCECNLSGSHILMSYRMIEEIARLEITYFTCASSCLNGKMIDKCSNTDRQHLYNVQDRFAQARTVDVN